MDKENITTSMIAVVVLFIILSAIYMLRATNWIIHRGAIYMLRATNWIIHRGTNIAENVIDNSLNNYEEFQNIYNTCKQIATDIKSIKEIPDNDPTFSNFNKATMILAKKQQLSRWVEEYNAKSKQWNRSMWKSNSLPHQLSINDF